MNRNITRECNEKLDQLKQANRPEPIRSDGVGALDLGPRNLKRDEENPDLIVPPATDHGLLPNLKFSFSDTHMEIKPGG
jgi:oxalate decarboxylase